MDSRCDCDHQSGCHYAGYGKISSPGGSYKPYRCLLRNRLDLEPGYALLADLQNTISAPPSHAVNTTNGSSRVSSPGYGSLNGSLPRGDYAVVNSTKLERSNSRTSNKSSPSSPIGTGYPNDRYSDSIENKRYYASPVSSSTPIPRKSSSTSFNNNLSELDNLLQDLSTSRSSERNVPISSTLNGKRSFSPTRNAYNHVAVREQSSSANHPSVDTLLDELNTSMLQNGKLDNGPYVMKKMTMEETTTTTTRTIKPTASSATRELDDLMASLSDIKVTNSREHAVNGIRNVPSSYAQPNSTVSGVKQYGQQSTAAQLDSMLGTLQEDMNRQGVIATQKGCCNSCEKPIVGQVITALGKTWHPEHFTCFHCKQELGTRNFFERDTHPYCELDYHNLFSPKCAYCNGPILDKCVTALEKTWHTEHFFCAQCGKQFGEDGFHEREGRPYCKQDYFNLFAPKCGACFRPIMENYVSALSSQWHSSCFVCRDCRQPFHNGSFFDHEGQPYCETHYHAKRGSLCAGCHKPITGRCITAMFRKFHPEHFVCAFCLKQLNKGTFKEQNDKPYCHACFDKLFG